MKTQASSSTSASAETGGAPWWGRAISLVLLLGIVAVAGRSALEHPWTAAAIAALVAFFVGVAVLRARSTRAGMWIDRLASALSTGFLRGVLWFAIGFGPLLMARAAAELAADLPLGAAVPLLGLWAAGYLFLVLQVSTEVRRRRLWLVLRDIDSVTPFLYAFAVAFVAIILFSTLAFVLAERDVIHFGAASGRTVAEPADALDFFVWHLLDSVPAFDVTSTLRWKEPLGYTDGGVGTLVLAFKILVIAPIIAAFLAFWRYGREPAGAVSPTRLRLGDSPRAPRRLGR